MTTATEDWAAASPAVRARARWELLARPAQLTPPGDWNVWLFMAGRGAGKTRAAAEDMAYYGFVNPGARMAIVAPTYADARDTCVEGESGLLSILPKEEIRLWNRSMGELVLVNGARPRTGDHGGQARRPRAGLSAGEQMALAKGQPTSIVGHQDMDSEIERLLGQMADNDEKAVK